MRLLDLFCGAGGAAMGYHCAGFEVVGVDINPQKNYPFEFHQADALEYPLEGFDVIHASPPCQRYSKARHLHPAREHPDFIDKVRKRLKTIDAVYVIENVPGAPLINPIVLCGSSFGLRVRRHRLFESNISLFGKKCAHKWQNDNPLWSIRQRGGQITTGICYVFGNQETGQIVDDWKKAMGIDWMTGKELSRAIPPAYCYFIGDQLMKYLQQGFMGRWSSEGNRAGFNKINSRLQKRGEKRGRYPQVFLDRLEVKIKEA